jgi:hypothetical protein
MQIMEGVKSDIIATDNKEVSGNTQSKAQNREFLADLGIHGIAEIFARLSQENRTLVIPIGLPQAGKSLLLSSLLYYTLKGQDTLFWVNFENDFPYDRGRIAINKMIECLDKGVLYGTTRKGTFDLMGINITPAKPKLPVLRLAFLDLAGEDLECMMPNSPLPLPLRPEINEIFHSCEYWDFSPVFCIVTPFRPLKGHETENVFHQTFLSYIRTYYPVLASRCKIIIIVSQWDVNPEREKVRIDEYIREFRPALFSLIKGKWYRYGEFSVGRIYERTVFSISVHYPQNFWNTLYSIATGKSLNPKPFWKKLFGI